MNGFLLVDKATGSPSFKVVSQLRRLTQIKRVGFAGTLDPFASGLLIMALGREFTRQIDQFHEFPKTYEVTWVLGKTTPTLDPESDITDISPYLGTQAELESTIARFQGQYLQTPPQFSAKKVEGRAAYHSARAGDHVDLKPVLVDIQNLTIQNMTWGEFPQITLSATCAKGTYIRSLVADIATAVGSVGYAVALRRTQIGPYRVENAIPSTDLSSEAISSRLFHTIDAHAPH